MTTPGSEAGDRLNRSQTTDRKRAVSHTVDLVLCGGGLQNALIVAALFAAPGLLAGRPAPRTPPRTALLERAAIGGNHTWCCYASDLSPAMRRQIRPLVSRRWDGYEVRFPGYRRRISTPYFMVASERLRRVVRGLLEARPDALVWEHAPVARLEPGRAVLEDGRQVAGQIVVDARGADRHAADCGFQKFYGEEVTLDSPHGLRWPLVMDATVPQQDGFRFMYVLPLSPRRALIEDTSFSDGPELDVAQRRSGIAAWMGRHGWRAESVTRTEQGVLPMPWRMPAQPSPAVAGIVRGGYRGGWFHPGTGYSVPQAAELAALVATTPVSRLDAAAAAARDNLRRRARFCCLLNRLLFQAYPPGARRNIFERFFRLPEPTIGRFFSMHLRGADKARLLCGRPPRGLSPYRWARAGARRATPPWR